MSGGMRTQIEQTFDANASVYDGNGVSFFRPIGRQLVALVGPQPGQRVLDVGCGRGAVLFPLADTVGPTGEVVGIDFAKGMLDATAQELRSTGRTNVEVSLMDGADPNFAPGSFDAITGSMSIVMIPDLPSVLARYAKLLRPGGTLGFTAPAMTASGDAELGPFSMREMFGAVQDLVGERELAPMREMFETFAASKPEQVVEWLRAAGFSQARCEVERLTVTAESARAVLDWSWGHGMRMFWELLDDERRSTMERKVLDRAESMRQDDGTIAFGVDIQYFLAGIR